MVARGSVEVAGGSGDLCIRYVKKPYPGLGHGETLASFCHCRARELEMGIAPESSGDVLPDVAAGATQTFAHW